MIEYCNDYPQKEILKWKAITPFIEIIAVSKLFENKIYKMITSQNVLLRFLRIIERCNFAFGKQNSSFVHH